MKTGGEIFSEKLEEINKQKEIEHQKQLDNIGFKELEHDCCSYCEHFSVDDEHGDPINEYWCQKYKNMVQEELGVWGDVSRGDEYICNSYRFDTGFDKNLALDSILFLNKNELNHLKMLMGKDIPWQKKYGTGKETIAKSIYDKLKTLIKTLEPDAQIKMPGL